VALTCSVRGALALGRDPDPKARQLAILALLAWRQDSLPIETQRRKLIYG